MGVIDDLARAREAFERREWVAAYDRARRTPTRRRSTRTTSRAWRWPPTSSVARTTASRRCSAPTRRTSTGDEVLSAVRCGFWLAMTLISTGEPAVGGGWVSRCQRLLQDVDGDVVERGYVLQLVMFRHIFSGEFEHALEMALELTDYGRRFDDPDLTACGLNAHGRMLIYSGRVPEGSRPSRRGDRRGRDRGRVADLRGRGLLLADRGLPGGLRLRSRGRVDQCADVVDRRPAGACASSPASARCTAARSCVCAARSPTRSRSSGARPSGTPPPALPRPPAWPWPSAARCCASWATCRPPRRRTTRRSASDTRASRVAPCSGSTEGAPARLSAPSTGCSPSRWIRCTGPSCCPAPSRCSSPLGEPERAEALADELVGLAESVRLRRVCGRWPPTRGGRLCSPVARPTRRRARAAAGDGGLAVARRAVRGRACAACSSDVRPAVAGRRRVGHGRDRRGPGGVRRSRRGARRA